jgi:hypothetical protein
MHDTPTTENIGANYDDNTASAATRYTITDNVWMDCAPLQFGLEKKDDSRNHLPAGCTFSGNQVVRSRPHKSTPVIAGRLRDLTATDNVAYDPQADPDAPWNPWFRPETTLPDVTAPNPLTPADVGPDAP